MDSEFLLCELGVGLELGSRDPLGYMADALAIAAPTIPKQHIS